ncbi:MAG: 6-phosphogluconolactonase [Emcibacteraceae bacterium]|nr:6-phosphogluconolactonase [Emcibacteraceae bacterium]
MNITENKFDDRDLLIDQLLQDVVVGIKDGISDRDAASVLLSGGTTPGPLYEKLSEVELDWEKVIFAPTDERWVEPDHPDSNEKLIRETLLQNKAASAKYIGLKSNGDDPILGQNETEEKLKLLPMPLDIVLLGMGEDGHVASLFPGLEDTKIAMDLNNKNLCHAVRRGGGDIARMSLTLSCLLSGRKIFLLFYGRKKLEIFTKAKRQQTAELPVSLLLHQDKVPVSLYWAE